MHPLHTKETLNALAREMKGGERRTGRSTAIALATIAKAIRNPRQEILLEDHHRPSRTEGIAADRHLAATTRDIIKKLGLINLHVLPRANFEDHGLPCFKVVLDDMPLL